MKEQKPYIIGNHLFFLRDGSTISSPSAGDTSRTLAPDRSEETIVDLGVQGPLGVTPQVTTRDVYAPSTGKYVLYDVLETMYGLEISAQLEELSTFTIEHIWNATKPDGSDEYTPLGRVSMKGWLLIDQYDENNIKRNEVDVYVYVRFNGQNTFGDDIVRPTMLARVLQSTLNKGVLQEPA